MTLQYDDLTQQRNLLVLTSWSLTALSCLAAGVVMTSRDRPVQALAATSGAIAAIPGFLTQQRARQTALRLNDLQDINTTVWQTVETQARLDKGFQNLQPLPQVPKSEAQIPWFDWDSIDQDRRSFPHLAVLAPTGVGKSTLAEWLADKLTGLTVAIAPHYEPGDFPSADLVLCKGRNYGEDARPYSVEETASGKLKVIGEPTVFFKDIVSGRANPTCCQFLASLLDEMTRRYNLRERGKDVGEPINIILDEFNAYAKLKGVSDILKQIIREARKVDIRLVLLLQGKEAKALGIEGETSLRQSMVFVRLGKEALEHAKALAAKTKGEEASAWEDIVRRLETIGFPAMVDDRPAVVPDLRNWKPASAGEPLDSDSEPPETDSQTPKLSPEEQVLYRQMITFGRSQGFTDSDIIQNIMGYKGRRYGQGKAILEALTVEKADK